MADVDTNLIKDKDCVFSAACAKERMENPYCPLAGLLDELVSIGTPEALEMARQIAEESLLPRRVITPVERLRKIFKRR